MWILPRLRSEIGLRGNQTLGGGIIHEGPRWVARLEKSSISGTIGSVSVVIVNAWMPELAHRRWKAAERPAEISA